MAIEQQKIFNVPHLLWHTVQPFIIVTYEDPWTSHFLLSFWGATTTCYNEPRSPALEANALPLHHRSGHSYKGHYVLTIFMTVMTFCIQSYFIFFKKWKKRFKCETDYHLELWVKLIYDTPCHPHIVCWLISLCLSETHPHKISSR